MTDVGIGHTRLADSGAAGAALGAQIRAGLHGEPPHAVIVFASPQYDYETLLGALDAACQPGVMVGCSSAGEFTAPSVDQGTACAVGLHSSQLRFRAGLGQGLDAGDSARVATELIAGFDGLDADDVIFRSALILTDPLAGHADDLVEQLNLATAGLYQFFGGGAGDDAAFRETHVFYGTRAYTNAAVGLEILSNQPLGLGVAHGWRPASAPLRVTEAEGARLVSLNATRAIETFRGHAEQTGQPFAEAEPLPFFLHNVLGVHAPEGYKLRVPLGVQPDGAVMCAADVPQDATVSIMRASAPSAGEAAARATRSALSQLDGARPKLALFFDCVATRLRLGQAFDDELQAVTDLLGATPFIGCNTYGQIARAEEQFSGFHNCTAVVCVIPE